MLLPILRGPGRFLFGLWLAAAAFGYRAVPSADGNPVAARWVRELFIRRAYALQTGDAAGLDLFYARGTAAREALAHEKRRIKALHAWLADHQAILLSVRPNLRMIRLEKEGEGRIKAYVTLTTLVSYRYRTQQTEHTFGLSTYHDLRLERPAGGWAVSREWYEDPLCTGAGEPGPTGLAIPTLPPARNITPRRLAAARYADRFSGVVVEHVSDGRYNRRYPDLTFIGGDCANFVSQILTDREAGGIKPDWSWWCGEKSATASWARADNLVSHLLNSDLAVSLGEGDLSRLLTAGSLARLGPGDIVAYVSRGTVRHVSAVVARDSRGWPLVDSHTGDRYHVPFDLGWDSHLTYQLLQTALP